MGDVIGMGRFPKPRTNRERKRLRAKFARRPLSAMRRLDQELPAPRETRR